MNAQDLFNHEEEKNALFIAPQTVVESVNLLTKELITLRAQLVIDMETGCNYMFENMKYAELERMYTVFVRDE